MGTQRVLLTDKAIKALKPAPKGTRTFEWDAVVRHLCIRVTDKGAKSFMVRKRMSGAKNPVENVLGRYPALSLVDARKRAREALEKIAEGINPKKAEREKRKADTAKSERTFEAVAKKFKTEWVSDGDKPDTDSIKETKRIIDLYLIPRFGTRQIAEIKRSEVSKLLDEIAHGKFVDKKRTLGGPVMADRVLAQVRKMMNWHAVNGEDDDFTSPIVRGMARTKPSERQRYRTLSDEEIRALWKALDNATPKNWRAAPDLYAAFVKVLLLSAARRDELADMPRSELTQKAWVIPKERHKLGKRTNQPKTIPLSKAALAIIGSVPQIDGSDLVFTTSGKTAFSGFSNAKERLDRDMIAELRKVATAKKDTAELKRLDEIEMLLEARRKKDKTAIEKFKTEWWTLHDLRRTARTRMEGLGVPTKVAEHAIGHIVKGVEGTYNCWEYLEERRDAFEKLAALIEKIVGEPLDGAAGRKKRQRGASCGAGDATT